RRLLGDRGRHLALLDLGPGAGGPRLWLGVALRGRLCDEHLSKRSVVDAGQDERGVLLRREGADRTDQGGGGLPQGQVRRKGIQGREAALGQLRLRRELREVAPRQEGRGAVGREEPEGWPGQ